VLTNVNDAILLFSHGSVLCGAGENLRRLAERMRMRGDAPTVEAGYLNYSAPLFEDAFEKCVAAGATRVTIAPYFLVAGYFVKECLAPKIKAARERYPSIEVRLAEALRFHPALADALFSCAARAAPPAAWRGLLNTASQFCRSNPQCPLYGGERCPATTGSSGFRVQGSGSPNPKSEIRNPKSKSALLVMVHGSPRPESNRDMFAVVDLVRPGGVFPVVEVGFMECNEPSIPAAIAACVGQGAKRVIAVPYFLHAGNHVADDLPTLLEEAAAQYPEVEFLMGDYLGRDDGILDVLRDRVVEAR